MSKTAATELPTSDPLTQLVGLLQPEAGYSKLVLAGGRWSVRRSEAGRPFYCAVLEGNIRLSIAGQKAVFLEQGDFFLAPAAHDFTSSSLEPPPADAPLLHRELAPGLFQLGDPDEAPDVRMLVGHCVFKSHDSDLLVSLLPNVVHVRGQNRLTMLLKLLNEESRHDWPGRSAIMTRLLEVLLIEAFRSSACPAACASASPGLLRGLADERLSVALRKLHDAPTHQWTIAELAKAAGLSRTEFFERFKAEVGAAPMEYLLAWRMALAKSRLRSGAIRLSQVADEVGYRSASTFSVAFSRHVGMPPAQYARAQRLTESMTLHDAQES